MSYLTKAKEMALDILKRYPDLKEEVIDSWELMHEKISDGKSEELEVEWFLEQLEELKFVKRRDV